MRKKEQISIVQLRVRCEHYISGLSYIQSKLLLPCSWSKVPCCIVLANARLCTNTQTSRTCHFYFYLYQSVSNTKPNLVSHLSPTLTRLPGQVIRFITLSGRSHWVNVPRNPMFLVMWFCHVPSADALTSAAAALYASHCCFSFHLSFLSCLVTVITFILTFTCKSDVSGVRSDIKLHV